MRSLLLPTTPAILPTTQKHFDWAGYWEIKNNITLIFRTTMIKVVVVACESGHLQDVPTIAISQAKF